MHLCVVWILSQFQDNFFQVKHGEAFHLPPESLSFFVLVIFGTYDAILLSPHLRSSYFWAPSVTFGAFLWPTFPSLVWMWEIPSFGFSQCFKSQLASNVSISIRGIDLKMSPLPQRRVIPRQEELECEQHLPISAGGWVVKHKGDSQWTHQWTGDEFPDDGEVNHAFFRDVAFVGANDTLPPSQFNNKETELEQQLTNQRGYE